MCKIFCTQLLDKAPCILYLHSLIPNTVLQIKMYIYVPGTILHQNPNALMAFCL